MKDARQLYQEFMERIGEVIDLRHASALLQWDQEVHMPEKGAEARGCQLATLAALEHRMFTSDGLRGMVEELSGMDGLDAEQSVTIAETKRDLDRALRIPEKLVHAMAEAQSRAYQAWVEARKKSDFPLFLPHLETLVALAREKAECLGYAESPYDALLDEYERGMTASQLRPLFDNLAERQSALLARIMESGRQPDVSKMDRDWDAFGQLRLTEAILEAMGYDFKAGRQDIAVHPFTTTFDVCDVRVTTRLDPRDFLSAVSSSVHEGGHALYEQGFPLAWRRTPLADAPSLGMHESQSRLWENVVGRSLPFWRHWMPEVKKAFLGQADDLTAEDIFRAANRVSPSLIRVEADECTYNLHIILRFEIESALIEGSIEARHIPEIWNGKMRLYLGVDVPDDARGCLQDIHWSHGSFGYFPTYALGNLYAAQLMEKIERDIPDIWGIIGGGDYSRLLAWLRENIHRHGRSKTAAGLIGEVTGGPPTEEPFLRYLETKYGALYGLQP